MLQVHAHVFQFVYVNWLDITVPCVKYRPVLANIQITQTKESRARIKDEFPALTDASLAIPKRFLASQKVDWGVKQVSANHPARRRLWC
jgi:hypothetical protein